MTEIEATDSNFQEEVIEKSKTMPVLVDFWASWCSPCLMLAPVLEKIAKEYEGKVIVAKMSVEDNQEVPPKYNIMSIPSIKLFKNGEIVDSFVGAQPGAAIKEFLDKNV
tara:strand:- start:1099 stop:1425 length:327 start_codon:yes stop_codon:yes gene_type:complete